MSSVTIWATAAALDTVAEHRHRGRLTEARRILDVTGLAPDAGVNIEHFENERCGTIAYAEVAAAGGTIGIVAVVDAAVAEIKPPVFFSLEWEHKLKDEHRSGVVRTIDKALIVGAALTRHPASWASRQIGMLPGDIRQGADRDWPIGEVASRPLLQRALAMKYEIRTRPAFVDLRWDDMHPAVRRQLVEDQLWAAKADRRPPGQVEWRPSVITSVR